MVEDKIKLLLIADTYYPKIDGTFKFMLEFLDRSKKDFDISLLVPNFKDYHNTKNKTFLKVSKHIALSGYPTITLSFNNIKKLKNKIKENEIVFIQGPALLSYLAMFYGKRYKKTVVTYIHVISWELFEKFLPGFAHKTFFTLFRYITIKLYNRCSMVIVPYHDLKEDLEKCGVKTKIEVARLGVDINKFSVADKAKAKQRLKISSKKKVIGYVGRVSREKNVHTLAKAFKKLDRQDKLTLLIVGGGTDEDVAEFKKIKNCQLTGFVNNVEDYLQAMDVFVMPSLTETTSLATLEAMSTGLPVIATKVGYIKNYIIKDYNGIFAPKENPSMLKIKIQKLLDDEDLRKKLGQNARKIVAYSFSWERSINKIKRILKAEFYSENSE